MIDTETRCKTLQITMEDVDDDPSLDSTLIRKPRSRSSFTLALSLSTRPVRSISSRRRTVFLSTLRHRKNAGVCAMLQRTHCMCTGKLDCSVHVPGGYRT